MLSVLLDKNIKSGTIEVPYNWSDISPMRLVEAKCCFGGLLFDQKARCSFASMQDRWFFSFLSPPTRRETKSRKSMNINILLAFFFINTEVANVGLC